MFNLGTQYDSVCELTFLCDLGDSGDWIDFHCVDLKNNPEFLGDCFYLEKIPMKHCKSSEKRNLRCLEFFKGFFHIFLNTLSRKRIHAE